MKKGTKILLLLGSVLISQIAGGIYASHRIAKVLHYQPVLGEPMYGTWYSPFSWISWYMEFNSQAPKLFMNEGLMPCMYSFVFFFLITVIIIKKFSKKEEDSHGSAHFATKEEIYEFGHFPDTRKWWEKVADFCGDVKKVCTGKRSVGDFIANLGKDSRKSNDNNLMTGEGVFLGYLDDGTYLRDNAKTHLLICAPTRSGKGVGHIVPTLLTWKGSCVVTDIKGENWELTSGYRKSQLNNKTFMFKPTSPDSCHYNPLAEIRIGTTKEMGDLQLITKILVDPTGKGSEGENAHWINNAWNLLQGVVLHLLYKKRYHNVDTNGKPCKGTIANMSDVLDFLYDAQDGTSKADDTATDAPSAYEEAKIGEDSVPVYSDTRRMAGILGGGPCSREYNGAPIELGESDTINEVAKVAEYIEDYRKRQESMLDFELQKELDKANAAMDGGDGDEPEGMKGDLSGLQDKLQHIIFKDHQGSDGGWYPFQHAPDNDKGMFERLYPNKVSRHGMHPHVRQIFQSMIDKPDKEFGSILSTLDTALIIYRNPVIVENISKTDFVMKDIMDCKQAISLYLVFGPGEMDVVRPLVRVIVEALWRQNTEEMKFAGGKTVDHQHRLLMLLDEFPALGKMEALEVSEGFIAGYGMKAMIITQDLNQINKLYGKDNYVVSNCQVQVYHAPSDNNSGEYLSKKMGNRTIKLTSTNKSGSMALFSSGSTDSYGSRPLMYPDEVNQMSDRKLLLFCKGLAPVFCNKIRYFEDPVFAPRVKIKHPKNNDKVTNADRVWQYEEYTLLTLENEGEKKHI